MPKQGNLIFNLIRPFRLVGQTCPIVTLSQRANDTRATQLLIRAQCIVLIFLILELRSSGCRYACANVIMLVADLELKNAIRTPKPRVVHRLRPRLAFPSVRCPPAWVMLLTLSSCEPL